MNSTTHTPVLSAALWRKMLENGYKNLKKNMSVIDRLNVFPVPDGDTGKNMTMTLEGGVAGARSEYEDVGSMMKAFSRASLLSARGNSGVILSQFIRGLANGTVGKQRLTPADFACAYHEGVQQSYKAVAHPTEGTMLTVLREGGEALAGRSFEGFEECISCLLEAMRLSLQRTPDLLPVLKDAGVVDSGGAGIICIFEGMQAGLCGEEIDVDGEPLNPAAFADTSSFNEYSTLEFGYCTEFILQLMHAKTDIAAFSLAELTAHLETLGDSIVTVQEDTLVKVHVHTFAPEQVLAYARTLGEFISLKIENMALQHNEVMERQVALPHYKYAVVATATGAEMTEYFRQIGAAAVINGGATNNPSAEDFISAFGTFTADLIIVLPNDSNIILAANQAAEIYKKADVRVLETKTLAEGYSALSMMNTEAQDIDAFIEEMSSGLPYVVTGMITTATRDVEMNGVSVKAGQWLGLTKKVIHTCTPDPLQSAMELFAALEEMEDKQVVTVFCGKDVSEEEVASLEARFNEAYPLVEIGFIMGGMEVYRYIFAIE